MGSNLFTNPHRRYNPLTGEWVLVSPQRMKRPWQGRVEKVPDEARPAYDPACYLCPGNQRNNGEVNPDYKDVYIFTNDFPALLPGENSQFWSEGILKAEADPGTCRVVCFSPDHSKTLADMQVMEISKVVKLWQDEFTRLSEQPGIKNIQIFENKGELLGCSNPHPHGQIWAESVVPVEIGKRLAHQQAYFKKNGQSMLADYLADEVRTGERIISANDHCTALVPFWAVWPYEVMIIANRHFSRVTDMTLDESESFAAMLSEITIRYDNLFQTSFPYSAGMQNAPVNTPDTEGWHFHYSFYPPLLRSANVRKFMVGYEMFANPQRDFTPEYAASVLRELPVRHYRA